ncbi:MAG: Spy/CpxP family protein refolding chaperone [Magnetococcales bacterium]|nr:Spy/CpxP family protein refolding chaperone [Magnetococcales bacterium]
MKISRGKILGVTGCFMLLAMTVAKFPLAGDQTEPSAVSPAMEVNKVDHAIAASPQSGPAVSEGKPEVQPQIPVTVGTHPGPGAMPGEVPDMPQNSGPMGHYPGMMSGGPGSMNHQAMGMTGFMVNRNSGNWSQGRGRGFPIGSMGFTRLATDTEAVERFLYDQKQRIAITSGQENAWNAFARSILNQISVSIEAMNTMRQAAADNPMDRTDQQLTAMETMVKQRRALFQDFRTLHGQLTAEQKPFVEQLYVNASESL